jgi:hypothetical protein
LRIQEGGFAVPIRSLRRSFPLLFAREGVGDEFEDQRVSSYGDETRVG